MGLLGLSFRAGELVPGSPLSPAVFFSISPYDSLGRCNNCPSNKKGTNPAAIPTSTANSETEKRREALRLRQHIPARVPIEGHLLGLARSPPRSVGISAPVVAATASGNTADVDEPTAMQEAPKILLEFPKVSL